MFKRFPFINNHGDFVHLDALREWFRGVVSLETFLKSREVERERSKSYLDMLSYNEI